jgi:hypothetical protein
MRKSMPTSSMCSIRTKTTMHRSDLIPLLGFELEKKKISYKPLGHDLFYVVVRKQSSDSIHTFEDRVNVPT